MRKLLLAAALALASTVAQAQNPQCPTRPAGDNTNACASTAFVQNSVGTPALAHTHIFVGNASNAAANFGTLATFSDVGTLNLTPTTGANLALNITQIGPTSGTVAGNMTYNQALISDNTALATPLTSFTYGARVILQVDGLTGRSAGAIALSGTLHHFLVASATGGDLIALEGACRASLPNGGAPGTRIGTCYGASISGHLFSGATDYLVISGVEFNAIMNTGSSADHRWMVSSVGLGDLHATLTDAAYEIGCAQSTGCANTGILFNTVHSGGSFGPIATTGTMFGTDGTAFTIAKVMDLTNVTTTGNFITGPNSGVNQFTVGATAIITGRSLVLNGSTSGTVTQTPPAIAGTVAIAWGTSSGTPGVVGTGPVAVSAAGVISCTTCVTSSGGGAISGTAPISVSAGGVVSLDAAGVTYAKIQNLGALAVMGRSVNSSGVGADIQATAASDAVFRESGSTIGFGTIATAGIANNAVTLAKLATQATNTILANATSGSAVPTAVTIGSCSTASSALLWTTNTGFSCNTSITAAAVPASGLTGATLAAGVTASSLTSLGTITTLTATTINAFTLAGTISGGGNQINNIVIGNSTPLAGSFTTLVGTGGTHTGITSLGIRDTSAAFDVTLAATSSAALSAGRTLTLNMSNVAHTLAFGSTANTITFPSAASYTVAALSVSNTFTVQQIVSGALNDAVQILSGAAGSNAGVGIGRTATDGYFVAIGAAAGYNPVSLQGDVIIRGTSRVLLDGSNGGTNAIVISTTNTLTLPTVASDAASTDNTMCITAAGLVLKGSGTLGICLGTSGEQFKTAFTPMQGGLEELANLSLWNYRYRTGFGDSGAKTQYGPTAQDVEKVLPDLVGYDQSGTAINYDGGALVMLSVRAIQQLKAANDNLAKEVQQLKQARN